MGEAYLQLCDFQSAAQSYRQACYLDPEDTRFFHRLAFIYYLQVHFVLMRMGEETNVYNGHM